MSQNEVGLAIVGLACRYPDARSPGELWESVIAQRRAFRRMPASRLRLEDYFAEDPGAADRTYAREAAVIEGHTFDRLRFRVAGRTFRSADMTHWLALEVASDALRDAGFEDGRDLPRETTGVVLGNTLTGEFSRANVLRLRWPYVRRTVEDALLRGGWAPAQAAPFLAGLEASYKAPFPPVDEETLAGGLSNTIAGRICNHFDLKGGGYTVDGACASSLLALTQACTALAAGDLDVVLAGGVDLSLDPFELVGFAKTGALAPQEMRVYDVRSAGFWPGEGCGFAVLMRQEEAVARGLRVLALVRGWGVSSDGQGGITRPEVEGQRLALRRAYRRAGFGIDTVGLFEGHGTGTAVGDATELQALSSALREAVPSRATATAIGTVKANIGHTKAAAGIAGLIKATLALQAQVLPPTTGVSRPHPLLQGEGSALRVLADVEPWPADRPLRAAVSAMGFGGINTHVVLEAPTAQRRGALGGRERRLAASAQDGEVLLLADAEPGALAGQARALREVAAGVSRAELADLAFELQRHLPSGARVRAAVIASTPAELSSRLEVLEGWLAQDVRERLDVEAGVFLGTGARVPRVGFLFPGQGSPSNRQGGTWRRRFASVRALYAAASPPEGGDTVATEVVQPAIATASLAGLRVLSDVGLTAEVALGHSLGELAALCWAGCMDEEALLRLAHVRGRAMAELGAASGAMASLAASATEVEPLLAGLPAGVAACNSPRQTVVSGEAHAVDAVLARARQQGRAGVRLAVSHAFHSPLVAQAAEPLRQHLSHQSLSAPVRTVVSTVTGTRLDPAEDLGALLTRQLTAPVLFTSALAAAGPVDLWLEVGPGHVLSGLVAETTAAPTIALDAGGASLLGLLRAVGAAFALGAPCVPGALFDGRFTRPFDLNRTPTFFSNPCEAAPVPSAPPVAPALPAQPLASPPAVAPPTQALAGGPVPTAQADTAAEEAGEKDLSTLALVRRLVAARAELPEHAIRDEDRLLGDLHLNSISVGQIAAEAARRLGLPPPSTPLQYAQAQVRSLATALEELKSTGGGATASPLLPAGVDAWVRGFAVVQVERPRPPVASQPWPAGGWTVLAPEGHPLAAPLLARLEVDCPGTGIAVCLPAEPGAEDAVRLLRAAKAALEASGPARLLVVQHGGGASAFARTLHQESPSVAVAVVDVPGAHPRAAEWAAGEVAALGTGLLECRYTQEGVRQEPSLRPLAPTAAGAPPLGTGDVLLVTGGGKGIAAECALELARATGVRLGLLGRSHPQEDTALAANLARFEAAGARAHYVRADVADAEAVRRAVREVEAALGPVTAILHGAGTNVPRLLGQLEEATLRATLAPKVDGLRHVLAAVSPERLRLCVAFSSIIGRLGMAGEADYALANAWLTREVERLAERSPACRCLSLEWSVWSGVGMGERLGRVDALERQGISPIPPEQGVALLRELLSAPGVPVAVVASGRVGAHPPLRPERPPLPFLRFLDQVRVHYPGVELVVDTELSTDTDPSLEDHVFRGERLLPAVLGLEAMAQLAMALAGRDTPPDFERVAFERPVVVPGGTRQRVRVAALVRAPEVVDVVLRCEATGFQADHFRATCRWPEQSAPPTPSPALPVPPEEAAAHQGLEPRRDLYGGLFFHGGRFQRIARYLRLRATACVAELTPPPGEAWFARYLPDRLVLGDPSARDAALHAIQACIPHGLLLPVGVDAVRRTGLGEARYVVARELSSDGHTFVYEVELCAADGLTLERWERLRLRRMEAAPAPGTWSASLLAPYVERRLGELLSGAELRVALDAEPGDARPARTDRMLRHLLGTPEAIHRRPDGKPVPPGGIGASAAHAGSLTLAVAGPGDVGCDVQAVEAHPAPVWRELLGPERTRLAEQVALEQAEDTATAATRVWAALECLKKAGLPEGTPLVLAGAEPDGWVLFGAGARRVATLHTRVRGVSGPLVLAALPGGHHARV
jgi:enediyne polyketide synthase